MDYERKATKGPPHKDRSIYGVEGTELAQVGLLEEHLPELKSCEDLSGGYQVPKERSLSSDGMVYVKGLKKETTKATLARALRGKQVELLVFRRPFGCSCSRFQALEL